MSNVRIIEPLKAVNLKRTQLDIAKEILAEVFHVRPSIVEDMIHMRQEERSLAVEQGQLSGDGLWPATFCLG